MQEIRIVYLVIQCGVINVTNFIKSFKMTEDDKLCEQILIITQKTVGTYFQKL